MSLTISDAGINVQISRETRAPTQQEFGTLLFLNPVGSVVNRITGYTSLAAVAVDYDAADEPYKAAASYYGQSPSPISFKVGEVLQGSPFVPGIHASSIVIYAGLATTTANVKLDIDAVQYTVTGIQGEVAEAAAVGSFDLDASPNAAGDGDVGLTIDGVSYTITPSASDDPSTMAVALAGVINGGSTHTASSTVGNVTITAVTAGSIGNLVDFVDATTDTGAIALVVQPSGGVDGISGTTGAEIATLMAIQINNGGTHTASPSGENLTITNNDSGVAGNSVVLTDVESPTGISVTVNQPAGGTDDQAATAGENLSDALDAIVLLDSGFYCVTVAQGINDTAEAENVAIWTLANDRVFFAVTSDPETLLLTDTTSQMLDFQTEGYDRTIIQYSTDEESYPSCSAFGILATTSFRGTSTLKTLKFKDLPGVAVENISPQQLDTIKSKNGNVFYVTAGIRMYDSGVTSGGSWMDEIHGMDALAEEIRVRVFGLLARVSTKVPYNESGMSSLEAEVEGALGQFVTNGYLTSRVDTQGDILPAYLVWHLPVIDASAGDKAARIAPDIEFTARLAGAIHEVLVNGVLTLD